MFEITLTSEQLNNLKAFLCRVVLKGAEVPAFLEIMQAIEKGVTDDNGK